MLQQYYQNGVAMGLYDPTTESAPGVPLGASPQAAQQAQQPQQAQQATPPGQSFAAMMPGSHNPNPGQSAPMSMAGLSPGRSPTLGMIGQVAGMANPILGMGIGAMNAGQGAISGLQQLAAEKAMTGTPTTDMNNFGAMAAGGFGMPSASSYGRGLGGYGNMSNGGINGIQNAVDPGVDGPARAMSATATQAINQAAQNPTTNTPQGYAAAVHAALNGGNGGSRSYEGYGGGGGQAGGTADTGMSGAGFAQGGIVTGPVAGGRPGKPGLVTGTAPGQADSVPRAVAAGSLVIPAGLVSQLGQGNTMAGAAMLHSMVPHAPMSMAAATAPTVRTHVSSGEDVITPQQLSAMMAHPQGAALLRQIMQALPQQQVSARPQ